MPRVARGLADGLIYHIINRGNGRQEVFHKEQDYLAFVEIMKEALQRFPVRLYAYCLLPNHFHLLVAPESADDLSKLMQWFMTSHVRRYHRHYRTSGHIWQGRFKSFIVQDDSHLLTVVRYIEGNAVRAGLVASAIQWKWSSHFERMSGSTGILSGVPITLPDDWTNYVDDPQTDSELEKLRRSVNRQTPYGGEEWQIQISNKLGLGSTMNPRGRPKKRERKSSLSPL